MHRNRKRNLIQQFTVITIFVMAAASILLTGIFSLYYSAQASKSTNDSIRLISEQNAGEISSVFERMEMSMDAICDSTSGVLDTLLLYNGDAASCLKSFEKTRDLVHNYISVALQPVTNYYHVFFYVNPAFELAERLTVVPIDAPSLDGKTWLYSDESVCNESWYISAVENPNHSIWFSIDENDTLYMARSLQYLTVDTFGVKNVSLGVILIKLNTDWLNEFVSFSELTADTQYLLLDGNMQMLYSSDSSVPGFDWTDTAIETYYRGGLPFSISRTTIKPDMTLITLVPRTQYLLENVKSYAIFLGILLVILLFGAVISYSLSRNIAGPILNLANHMRQRDMKHIRTTKPIYDEDVQILYDSYNHLVDSVRESIRQKLEYAEREKELELNVLQAQINPHFLCNALNSVFNLASLHDEKEIAHATEMLCVFLRYNISAPDISIPLQRELDMLESYVALQNVLCGDKIIFETEMENIDCELTYVPKMLLQPLVENCILHGARDGYVDITIRCRITENHFTILVIDNGESCSMEELNAHLLNKPQPSDHPHGFGLYNVRQRIQMKFNDSCGLHFERIDNTTAACVDLPLKIVRFPEQKTPEVSL